LPECSRARWQKLIKDGHVTVDGRACKPNHPLGGGEHIAYDIPPPARTRLEPEPIPLDILYEDADVIVVNKPPHLVVHPAAGHGSGTLVNALLHHCNDPAGHGTRLAGIGGELRPGIVHRLDKDTSGVLVVAKNDQAMQSLVRQFKERAVRKEYLALVWGQPRPKSGVLDTLVGRSVHNRKKMTARPKSGRRAVTRYDTVETFDQTTLLRVVIETGRTHQIRVHMSHMGHPVVGDRQYGRARQNKLPAPAARQMLHAEVLTLEHPGTGKPMTFKAPLPTDMRALLTALRA